MDTLLDQLMSTLRTINKCKNINLYRPNFPQRPSYWSYALLQHLHIYLDSGTVRSSAVISISVSTVLYFIHLEQYFLLALVTSVTDYISSKDELSFLFRHPCKMYRYVWCVRLKMKALFYNIPHAHRYNIWDSSKELHIYYPANVGHHNGKLFFDKIM